MKTDIIAVLGLFLVIMFISLWFSSIESYVPYSSVFSKYATYEPFTNSLEYSSVQNNSQVDGPVMNHLFVPTKNTIQNATNQDKLDIYSDAPGDINGNGWGYYNSMGSLVLDENMKKMLYTRGLNATGVPSQIGGSPV
jgi:hypothetical protein